MPSRAKYQRYEVNLKVDRVGTNLGEHHLQTFSLLATQAGQAHTFIHVLNIDRVSTMCLGSQTLSSWPSWQSHLGRGREAIESISSKARETKGFLEKTKAS